MNVTQSRIREAKRQVAAYLESHPEATTSQIAMELHMSARSVLYRKKSLGIQPKPSRISLVRSRIMESPCTDEMIAQDLKVPLRFIQDDLWRLQWMGEIVGEKLWRIR
jgi:hypothetical protein